MFNNLQELIIVLVCILLVACTTPARRLDGEAARLGFARELWKGTDFIHIVYQNRAPGALLHVYLDGDGTPWLRHTSIATDPTPRNPLMLELMAQDPRPAVYLGRPCYHGQSSSPSCSPALWTAQRYGPRVVNSMAAALRGILEHTPYEGVVLIGYSGGGALAMLLAEHFQSTRVVVTVAGNLNPAAWTEWHGYSPLRGSLNPAFRPPLDASIVQLHFAGGRDENIPVYLIQPVVSRQRCAKLITIGNFDHRCCWQVEWSAILNQLTLHLSNDKLNTTGSLANQSCTQAVF